LNGPFVMPGQYTVTLKVDGKEIGSQSFTVLGDPDITVADADRKAAFDAAIELHQLQRKFNDAADRVNALNERLRAMQAAMKESQDAPAALKSRVEEFGKKFAPVGRNFGIGLGSPLETGDFESFQRQLRARIGQLKGGIMAATSRPTETQMRLLPEVHAALDKAINEANALIGEFPALSKEVAESGVYPAAVRPIGK